MTEVGIFEAKTHLSALLERVAQGEEITITRHGSAVARLVPVGIVSRGHRSAAAQRLKSFRAGRRLGGSSLKGLIEEGRR